MKELQPLRVLIVEDETHFRQGLRTFLSFFGNQESHLLEIIGEADSADQAIQLAEQQPALILLDLELAESSGIQVLQHLQEHSFKGKVLVLSGHQEDDWIFQAIQAGATGYVFKHQLLTQLPEAIRAITRSEMYLPPAATHGFFRRFQSYEQSRWRLRQQYHLTEREKDVLNWLAQGASNEEISRHLYVTVATVKAHLTNIFEKLEVTSRTQAIVAAFKLGLVQNYSSSYW
ncbi:MAG: response regulator transcription factor [Cyanobacteria bacterium RM1_2_2]|nr:response regulator transcription factor [Cyanobacteria bacterium RM1_2_2]